MKIANLKLKNNLFLAPMAGVCDVAFRVLCKKYGAGLVYSEFVNVEGISREIARSIEMINTVKEEQPVVVQIFGTNLASIAASCKILQDKADIIDFNLGCPAHKVTCTGAGAALLNHPEKIGKIIAAMVENSSVPITAKIRRLPGYAETIKITKIIEKAGASAITLHPRTVQQNYSANADWSFIKAVKEASDIPVFGNGDVKNKEDYINMLAQTNCDGVLIGRAAMKNPGIFSEILSNKPQDNLKMFFEYYKLAKKFGILSVKRIKFMAQNFTRGLKGSSKLRESMNHVHDVEEILGIMDKFKC